MSAAVPGLAVLGIYGIPYRATIVIMKYVPVALSDGMPGGYTSHGYLRTEELCALHGAGYLRGYLSAERRTTYTRAMGSAVTVHTGS